VCRFVHSYDENGRRCSIGTYFVPQPSRSHDEEAFSLTLQTYRAKRQFSRTPEPHGKRERQASKLRFVVQKHAASRLHYDFRLEMEGVLKSWAVPKEPSLNPADKRLAVMVEDHPLEYRRFEGTIPEGNYGAGEVIVWDEGTYEPLEATNAAQHEETLLRQLKAGHIRFVLHGKKLKGGFSLVKTRGGKGNHWLLFKRNDEFATTQDVLEQIHSVRSNRSLDDPNGQSTKAKPKRTEPATNGRPRRKAGAKDHVPHRVQPMLATLVDKPFDRPDWIFEIKWDGYRAIAAIIAGKVQMYSRRHLSYEQRFPRLLESLSRLGHDAVIDGEIVVLDSQGKSDFQLLQNYQRTQQGNLVFIAFDLLYLDGKDLRPLPLIERKEELARLIQRLRNVRFSEHVVGEGMAFFQAAAEKGLEGIIAKNAASPYREGSRSWDWLKIKSRRRQEAVIGGFTAPRGTRQALGSLVLGVYEGDELIYVGHAGGGFDSKILHLVRKTLDPLVREKCPFKEKPKTNMPATWVKPTLVCEVAFQEWTSDGLLRMPIFQGLREDKKASAVHREIPKELPSELESNPRRSSKRPDSRSVKRSKQPAGQFTNLEKVYFPDDGFTKGDVLAYYRDIASVLVPHLRDRPFVLNRHPDGIHEKNFFQKDVSRNPPPDWVQTTTIRSESDGRSLQYIMCQDKDTLLYLANLGCIEMNPWTSRVKHLDKPDYMILDLDPQDVSFAVVVETAQSVRKLLETLGIDCFCKTSGKRGLHVYSPLGAKYTNDTVRQFAETVARLIQSQHPETTSVTRMPASRRRQVYIDFLQNGIGKTTAAAYSVRPVPGACVSTPLQWREISKRLDPTKFTIQTMQRRVDKKGDLWAPTLGPGADLSKALDILNERFGVPQL